VEGRQTNFPHHTILSRTCQMAPHSQGMGVWVSGKANPHSILEVFVLFGFSFPSS